MVGYLRYEVEIWNKGRLQNDGHVRRVKKLDWVRTLLATGIFRPNRQDNTETLEVNNNKEHKDRGKKIGHIWKILSIESLPKCTDFISSCYK